MRPTFHEAQLEDPQHHRKRFYLDLTVHYYHSPLIPHSCFSLDETKYVILLSSSCNDFVIQTLLEKIAYFINILPSFKCRRICRIFLAPLTICIFVGGYQTYILCTCRNVVGKECNRSSIYCN